MNQIKKVAEDLDPLNFYRDTATVDTNHTEQMLAPNRTVPLQV